ncbi:uncharacterized protein [Panulirus ornatus]|uniref:uncharacterized protein n=1 Tax=Panulirus ornatus TaxID=150431 RepID=UPI003A88D7C7
MSSAPTPRSQFKTNLNKYTDAMREVVNQEMCRVFLWLYKGGTQYVGDYLQTFPGGMKYLNKDEKALLERKEPPTKMDIAFLYRLLQFTCGLAKADNSIWNDPQPSETKSIEHSLYLLKEERNRISHETQRELDDEEFDEKLENLRSLCCQIICEAGRLSQRHNEISRHINKMQAKFQDIIGITAQKFAQLAKQERQKVWKCQEEQDEIISDQGYSLPLLMNKENAPFHLTEILRCQYEDGSPPNVILIIGEAGAGKTSLSRYLEKSWLLMKDEIQDLLRCDLLIGTYCRDITTSDTVRLLMEDLLPETTAWCDPYKLMELLRGLRMIWVLDGLEEAREDAIKLIDKMLEKKLQSHTLVITSRPENGLDLQHRYTNLNIFRVNLCGVDPTEKFKTMQLSQNGHIYSEKCEQFIADFIKLDKEVKRELQNPLKMELALQDWDNIFQDQQDGFDLSRLYLRIKDAGVKSLVEKFTRRNITAREAKRKVEKWFDFLCKVAFDMTRALKMNTFINGSELKELEDKCDDLQISSSECLSTFLAHNISKSPPGCIRYSFFHSTQQYFLASLYGVSSFKASSDILSLTSKMFGISKVNNDSDEPEVKRSLVHFQEVLLHMISMLQSSLTDEGVKVLVKLLSYAIPEDIGKFKWFKVIQKGSYDKRIIKEVSEVIPKTWLISDSYVKAARSLMKYTEPYSIVIHLVKNPRESPDLLPLLQKIADLQYLVWVELYLSYHFQRLKNNSTSDEYLLVLIHEDSSCVILGFEGHLSDEGYDLLKVEKMADYCEVLKMKVKSTDSITLMCDSLRELKSLQIFQLTLALRNPSYISATLPDNVDLYLPYMDVKTTADTATLACRLSHAYKRIRVRDISVPEATKFVLRLKEKGVKVQSFVREVTDTEKGCQICLSYGSLPLPYSILDFKMYWLYWNRFIKHDAA